MKMRKIITGLLSLAFVFSMSLNSMAFAEEVVTEVEVVTTQAKSEEFVISLGTVDVEYADQDQVVSIPVSVDANPGFAAALIDFALSEGMEIVGLKDGLITDLAYNASRVIWVNGVSGDFKENGVLFYVDVLVPAGSSDLYEISVISHEESFVDSEYNTCVPAMASGAVNILGAPEVTTITDVTEPEVTTVTDVTEPEVTTATDVTEPTVTTKVTKEHNCGNKPGHHKKDKKPKCEKPQVTKPVKPEKPTKPEIIKPVKPELTKPVKPVMPVIFGPKFVKPEFCGPICMKHIMFNSDMDMSEVVMPEVIIPEVVMPEVIIPEVGIPEVVMSEVDMPEVVKPVEKPISVKPTKKRISVKPIEKPQVTEPVATEQVVVKPVETEPVVVKPVEKTEVIKPERTRPEFTKPERTRPEKKNKEVTEPEVTIVTEIAEEV